MTGLMTYPDARYLMRTGAVVTFDGNDLLSRAIKFFAPKGSHTAMILRLTDCPDTILLFESLEHGPTITRMSRRISNYSGLIHVSMPAMSIPQEKLIAAMALRMLGSRIGYDYPSLFRQIRKRVALNMTKGFCSETIQYLLSHAGVLPPQIDAMTPGELRDALGHEITLAPYTADCETMDTGGMA
jgi:hypothetical protein